MNHRIILMCCNYTMVTLTAHRFCGVCSGSIPCRSAMHFELFFLFLCIKVILSTKIWFWILDNFDNISLFCPHKLYKIFWVLCWNNGQWDSVYLSNLAESVFGLQYHPEPGQLDFQYHHSYLLSYSHEHQDIPGC